MIIRLREEYMLRGWKGASCALVNRTTRQARFYNPELFNLLLLADGVTELSPGMLSDKEQETLDGWLQEGILEECPDEKPLLPKQEYRTYPNRYVREAFWSVTGRCNFRCRHCYMDAPNGALGEVSHEEAMDFIDQMAACGILQVSLTGGETFVRPDIMELIAYITEKGMRIDQIYTNGWLVSEAILDRLAELGQKPEFSFSFDGVGWHDWMRGVKGAEERVLSAIHLCRAKGFGTSVETCLHKGNLASFPETVRLMGSLDTRIKVGSVMNTALWQKNSEGRGLSDEEYFEAMLAYIPQFFADGMPAELVIGSVIRLHKGSTDSRIIAEKRDGSEKCLDERMCGAARTAVYITPEGRLLPCMPMTAWEEQSTFKRIQDVGMQNGLTDGFYMNFVNGRVRELFEKNEKCNACEYKLRCGGGCRAMALATGGGLYGSDPNQCLYWKNGYVHRIRSVTEAAIAKYCGGEAT